MRWQVVAASVMLAPLLGAAPARAADCAALARLKVETTNLLSSVEVPAAGGLPAYCRVLGYVRPAINFELRLPLADWNGKFYEAGCGGFCGALDADRPNMFNSISYALRRNYAVLAMDSGHWGANAVDARWASGNPDAKTDWAWRAVTETARVGKFLLRAFYGAAQSHAYFNGCSTGGRMAGIEATRFPVDFDGIVMGAPALDYTGLVATEFAWVAQANTGADGKPVIGPQALPLIRDAVLKACKTQDGMLTDPRTCGFKPASLLCHGDDSAGCLSGAQVSALEKLYAGPHDSAGRQLYPGGIPLGSEANWGLWITGTGSVPPTLPLFARDFLRYMAFEPDAGPTYNFGQFDFDRDPARLAPMAALYNAATWVPAAPGAEQPGEVAGADLSAFARAGGRMIVWHGWGDPLVPPFLTIAWYDAIAKAAGGLPAAQKTARLFLIPGMDHCGINVNNASIVDSGIDPLTALEAWVEHGNAPDSLLATKRALDGRTLWQHPICAYPTVATPTGGDPAQAANWTCSAP
jgi:feruloyl esterase